MLQIKNISITHRKDNRILMENVSFTVNPGEKVAIIGEEGNGKSTLLKLIVNDAMTEDYVEYSGEIIKNNLKLGYLAQELDDKCLKQDVYEFMCEEEGFYTITPKELAGICTQISIPVELLYSEQKMSTLSGGEKVKIQMARILIGNPDYLLLDEPSNDLDMDTLIWLEKYVAKSNLGVLYISHDVTFLENTATKIVHIEQLKRKTQAKVTVKKSGYDDYVSNRSSVLEHQEQVARKERSNYEKQQEKFRQIQQKVEYQQATITRQNPHGGALLKKTMHRIKAYEARFQKEYENMTEIPETEDAIFIKFGKEQSIPNGKLVLEYSLPQLRMGDKVLAENIFLRIRGPEKICIIGKNGIGKTTLIRKIVEELKCRTDIKVGYMPQKYEELLDMKQTPVDFLCKVGDKEEISKIRTFLGSMKYTADEMGHSIEDLSGGQKAKLFLLKMSVDGCNVLVLDEPTRNFSPLSNPVILGMLKTFEGAIISISHDRKYLQEVPDRVYELTWNGLVEAEHWGEQKG